MMISARYDYPNLIRNNMEFICISCELEHAISSDYSGNTFLELVEEFLDNKGDPNLIFSGFEMEDHSFRNVTFFQVVYLYWQNTIERQDTIEKWDETIEARFKKVIDQMLKEGKVDLRAKFNESYLAYGEHFVHDFPRSRAEGYLLERATIAHYAMAKGDFKTVDKILQKAPELLHETCCLMKGKNLLCEDRITVFSYIGAMREEIEWNDRRFNGLLGRIRDLDNDETAGELAVAVSDCEEEIEHSVKRITKVSLLHLAARVGHESACRSLQDRRANFIARDSDGLNPCDYLKRSLSERFIVKGESSEQLAIVLDPITRITKSVLHKGRVLLREEGYWIVYDTSAKVMLYTYEYFTKGCLEKKTTRSTSFTPNPKLSRQEQASNSAFKGSSKKKIDKGHGVPAGNAKYSQEAMTATFSLTNVFPQNSNLNRGFWKKLEGDIRKLAVVDDLIEIFTGCLFLTHYQTLGKNNIPIPTHLFKVLHFYKGSQKLTQAVIVPNAPIPPGTPYTPYFVSVNYVQRLTGILFEQWRL